MKINKILIQFISILLICLIVAFIIQDHLTATENEKGLNLEFTYSFNLIFTLPFVILMFIFIKKIKTHIGFIFMGLGFIKVITFLVYTKWEGIDINRGNFLMFFIPYTICLLAEIFVLSKYLNKADF